jgi:hypothetical protein
MSEARINVYVCQKCGGHTVTVDVDEGVTPFMIGCHAREATVHPAESGDKKFAEALERDLGVRIKPRDVKRKCDGMAHSSFYPRGPKPSWIGEPQWEWYKPEGAELAAMSKAMQEHVAKGGLAMRKRTEKAMLMHGA